MTKIVYTSESRVPLIRLISPGWIVRDLWARRELILGYARREFDASYRSNTLGAAWTVMSPLIMLAMFTLVFGKVFNGRFNPKAADETSLEFALALFVGLSLFNCVAYALNAGPNMILSNSPYVKSLSFPIEILAVSSTLVQVCNVVIAFCLVTIAFLFMHGYIYVTAIWVVAHIVCVALISLGLSWFLSSLAVFVRDVSAITSPISIVLMFMSSVFFPMDAVPQSVVWLVKLNPLAVLIEQARGALLYGRTPELGPLLAAFLASTVIAVGGYWFFSRTKATFADVM